MPKLTDTQLVILSAAAQRDDGAALPLPKSLKLKGAAIFKTLDDLRRTGLLAEKPAAPAEDAWREDGDGRRMMLAITEAGHHAIDGGPAVAPPRRPAPKKRRAKRPGVKGQPAGARRKGQEERPLARQGTKQALMVDLLKRKAGATIDEIVTATGWQAHSVRGAISGALRKRLGLAVAAEKVDGRGRVYRIAGHG